MGSYQPKILNPNDDHKSFIKKLNDNNDSLAIAINNNASLIAQSPKQRGIGSTVVDFNVTGVYKHGGTDGVGGNGTVYTIGGGGSGDLASITVAGGIIIAVALVP